VATIEQIRDTAVEQLGRGGGAVLVADRTFIPLPLVMEGTDIPVYDVRRRWIPKHPRGRYLVVLWPDEVLSVGDPPTAPRKYLASNQYLRDRMKAKFRRVQLVRQLRQRDGAPLIEIWLAEMPLPARLRPSAPGPPETSG
jgi:hypothetical protein